MVSSKVLSLSFRFKIFVLTYLVVEGISNYHLLHIQQEFPLHVHNCVDVLVTRVCGV